MSLIKSLLLAVIVLMQYACTGQTALLRNDRGELAKCEVTQGEAMWSGVIVRDMTLNRCVEEYEKAGFRRISK